MKAIALAISARGTILTWSPARHGYVQAGIASSRGLARELRKRLATNISRWMRRKGLRIKFERLL